MKKVTYITKGVCSKQIDISIEKDILMEVSFKAGCSGNLQGISKLVEGMHIEDVITKLKGINCGGKGTSCPDQLSKALQDILINKLSNNDYNNDNTQNNRDNNVDINEFKSNIK